MRVVYCSDLHLEINGIGRANAKWAPGDVLILAGDTSSVAYLRPNRTDKHARQIKKAEEYLKRNVYPNYKTVLRLIGNHEHYGMVYNRTERELTEFLSDVPNLHLMENKSKFIGGVMFICATLWTNFDNGNPQVMLAAKGGMNDYNLIFERGLDELGPEEKNLQWKHLTINPEYTLRRHNESLVFIREALMLYKNYPTVVVTHHAPTFLSNNGGRVSDKLSPCYCSNLSELILDNPQIKYWIHGHTHDTKNYLVGDTMVISNQCGYHMDRGYKNFYPDAFIEV